MNNGVFLIFIGEGRFNRYNSNNIFIFSSGRTSSQQSLKIYYFKVQITTIVQGLC